MPSLDELRTLAVQVRKVSQELEELRQRRDDAMRAVRRTTEHTVPEIAEAAGVSQATVKTVIRGIR